MTVKQALEWGQKRLDDAGTHDPKGCTKFLLRHAVGDNVETIVVTDPERTLGDEALDRLRTMVDRRIHHEPVWYVTEEAYFWRDAFYVDDRVLIPRPETELVVETALKVIRKSRISGYRGHRVTTPDSLDTLDHLDSLDNLKIADIGTGCGAIAISLAKELDKDVKIYATDISPDAIAVAKENIRRHKMDGTITTLVGDALHPLPEPPDLIVGNPPYIPSSEIGGLSYDVHHFEPRIALDGGPDGLDVHRKIFRQASQGKLKKGGAIVLETGWDQGKLASEAAKKYFPEADIRIVKDYAEKDRIVVVTT